VTLKLRPTGLSSAIYQDQIDWIVVSGEFVVGRIYEERHAREELRWFWAINGVHAGPAIMRKDGRTPTLDEAKAQFADNWGKWLAWAALKERE
jgi:hypothetical protein